MLPLAFFSCLVILAAGLPAEKRQMVHINNMCPMVMCALPEGACPVPMQMSTMTFMNKSCPGCPFCPVATVPTTSKRAIFLTECPMFKCSMEGLDTCTEPLKDHTFNIAGLHCTGCPYCPTTGVVAKRVSILPIMMCPMVMCLDVMLDCPLGTTAVSTFTVSGHTCHGCPHCVHETTTTTTPAPAPAKREAAIFAHPFCPIYECFFPINDCTVPLKTNTVLVNGHECPECPYCPTDATASTDI